MGEVLGVERGLQTREKSLRARDKRRSKNFLRSQCSC